MKSWVVIVNRREAKIYTYLNHRNSDLKFVTKIENPRGRLKAQDIDADKPGVFSSLLTHGPRLVKKQTPTQRVAEEFAKEVAEFMDKCRSQQMFDSLILVAPPTFLGDLRLKLSAPLKKIVKREIAKDFDPDTSEEELKKRLFPEDEQPDYLNFL